MRRLGAFIKKDLIESTRNRSIFIAVLLPVLASLLFSVLDSVQTPKQFSIGVLDQSDLGFASFVESTALNFEVRIVHDEEEGRDMLAAGILHGLVAVRGGSSFQIFLDSGRPLYFFALKENLTSLIEVYVGAVPAYALEVVAVGEGRVSRSVLPVWITVTMSMIGIMVVSGMFAEEKDSRTLDAIGVSPVGYHELLIGKGVFGVVLSLGTVLIMLLLNGAYNMGPAAWAAVLILILCGSLCFTAMGLLIGVLSKGQSAARSAAAIVYFPLLFPTLISDLSTSTRLLAGLFPTYYLFTGLESILLHGGGLPGIWNEFAVLAGFSVLLLAAAALAHRRMVNVRV